MHLKNLVFSFFLFFFNSFLLKAQVFVTFNPEECSSCIAAFQYLGELSPHVKSYLVLKEKSHEDSAIISKDFFLNDFTANFLWSDSLFEQYSKNGSISTIHFEMDDGVHGLSFPLRNLTRNTVNWFNRQILPEDTLMKNIPHSQSSNLTSHNYSLALTNKIRNEISVYDLPNQKFQYRITFNDSIVKASFMLAFGDSVYEKTMKQFDEWKVPKIINIDNAWFDQDSLRVAMSYKCLMTYGGEEGVGKFSILNTYYKGKLDNVDYIPLVIEEGKDSFFSLPFLHFWENELYGAILGKEDYVNKYFLTRYRYLNHEYNKNSVFEQQLPKVYKNYNFGNVVFFKNYYALPLEDKIYSLEDGRLLYGLQTFPKDNQADLYKLPKRYLVSFKMSSSFIWVLYRDNEKGQFGFMKYDINKKTILFDKIIQRRKEDGNPVIADFNYNNILFLSKEEALIKKNFSIIQD